MPEPVVWQLVVMLVWVAMPVAQRGPVVWEDRREWEV